MTLTGLPIWVEYSFVGILVVYFIYCCGKILAKTGKSPLWSLFLLIPYLQIIALWLYAFTTWPNDIDNPKE